MATPTAIYNMPSPGPTTKFNKLGAEILAWTNAVDALLASFDYNGADPNLVLARVAALEVAKGIIENRVDALEAGTMTRQSGATPNIGALAANGGTFQHTVTFPQPFAARPMMGTPHIQGDLVLNQALWISVVTATGCKVYIRNLGGTAVTLNYPILWDAYGVLA